MNETPVLSSLFRTCGETMALCGVIGAVWISVWLLQYSVKAERERKCAVPMVNARVGVSGGLSRRVLATLLLYWLYSGGPLLEPTACSLVPQCFRIGYLLAFFA